MKTPQALFSNYIDQVCGMFGCMEATGPLKAGFQALCESTHTARAVEVHKWVKQAKEKIQDSLRTHTGRVPQVLLCEQAFLTQCKK